MKKKCLIISISIILLISLIAIIINKNSKEYIMQDGIMLALTLDGEKITEYPEGTNYGVEVTCENGKGKWLVDEWKLAVEEINANVACNIDFSSNPKTLISEVENKATTNENGYRYNGATPSNYIWFNNEMWRIIGSIPTCLESSCGTNTTNLVKIIRDESIGAFAISGGTSTVKGTWGSGTLKSLLNDYYYGAIDATDSSYCSAYSIYGIVYCDFSEIGISSNRYYGKMIKKVYWNTGSIKATNIYPSTMYTNEIAAQTVSGYVGLISLSDYAYGTDSSYYTSTITSNYTNSTITNWLYGPGSQWTLTNVTNYSDRTYRVSGDGGIYSEESEFGFAVRPVVYLDSSVFIISGDGSITNPYQIGM